MKLIDTKIADLKIIQPRVFGDERGFFMETYRDDWFKQHVANVDFVQDNHSKSKQGILRGLHYQLQHIQGKLVRVTAGEVYDVAVDMRKSSPTFGQWYGAVLSAHNKRQLWVPAGFAHGFYVTSDEAEFCYRCTDYYHPESEISVRFDDPDLAINWPIKPSDSPILSVKDADAISFASAPTIA